MELSQKRCLITGAKQGIGWAIAKTALAEGASVVATDKDEIETSENSRFQTAIMDVTDAQNVNKVFSEFGPFDCIAHCAGIVQAGTVMEATEKALAVGFDINVKAAFYIAQAAIPHMLDQEQGSIVNIASVASSIKGVPNRCIYGTTKAALIGLTKSIAADFVAQNIRCNAICPGTVDSPSLHERLKETGNYEQAMADFIKRQPMGRIGTAQEIADLAIYLMSDKSAFTTGQSHAIDGGWSN